MLAVLINLINLLHLPLIYQEPIGGFDLALFWGGKKGAAQ